MEELAVSIADLLFLSGLLGGKLFEHPTGVVTDGDYGSSPAFGSIALVGSPWKSLLFRSQNIIAGVNIGYHSGWKPDVILGYLTASGEWLWPTPEPGVVVAWLAASEVETYPREKAWPVTLTCAYYDTFMDVQKVGSIDVFEAYRKRQVAAFWDISMQEFIATTWHPARLAWCLDREENFLTEDQWRFDSALRI